MAKIWVKGYTKPNGTKVKGHYRDVESRFRNPKTQKVYEAKLRAGRDDEATRDMLFKRDQIRRIKDRETPTEIARRYGTALALKKSRGYSDRTIKSLTYKI